MTPGRHHTPLTGWQRVTLTAIYLGAVVALAMWWTR